MVMHAYHDHDGDYRYMVLAKNLKHAAELLGSTVNQIRNYGGRYPDNGPEHQLALTEPFGALFWKDMRKPRAKWLIDHTGERLAGADRGGDRLQR